jgi:hypothetical protein
VVCRNAILTGIASKPIVNFLYILEKLCAAQQDLGMTRNRLSHLALIIAAVVSFVPLGASADWPAK